MAPVPRRPPAGYEWLNGLGYYKLHTSVRNWTEASQVCRQENAHLMIINSEAEAKVIQPLWVSHPTLGDWRDRWSFVGIHDQFEEGKFITIFRKYICSTVPSQISRNFFQCFNASTLFLYCTF
jgi:hypothetical protein